jgi:hypothetical protein
MVELVTLVCGMHTGIIEVGLVFLL